jgi:hypothetical protein
MTDPLPNPDTDNEQYLLAGSMAAQWLAAYHAQDDQRVGILQALTADQRGLALAFGALGEMFLGILAKLDADGAIEGGVQVWLDRQALNFGAAADAVVAKYREGDE